MAQCNGCKWVKEFILDDRPFRRQQSWFYCAKLNQLTTGNERCSLFETGKHTTFNINVEEDYSVRESVTEKGVTYANGKVVHELQKEAGWGVRWHPDEGSQVRLL